MIATHFSAAGNPTASTVSRAASAAPAQRTAKPGKKPFTLFAALNQASLWFSQSRTTWSTAGQTLN